MTSAAVWRPDHQSHSVRPFDPGRPARRSSARNDAERGVRARLNPRVLFWRGGRDERALEVVAVRAMQEPEKAYEKEPNVMRYLHPRKLELIDL